ncbi:unnamed protein product, partial [Oikopleura dioica]
VDHSFDRLSFPEASQERSATS